MPDEDPAVEKTPEKTATGRTVWDAIVDIAKMLGPYAPWIIMVGGVVYAGFKFTELQETAQVKAREEVQKELDSAHTELRETYNQIGEMNKQELSNVSSMLNVHDQTVKSTEEQRKKYNDLREQALREQEEADKARTESERAKAETAAAINRAQELMRAATEAKAQAEKATNDLDRKSEEINQRASKIGDLNQKLMELARAVATTSITNETVGFARKVLTDYSPEPKKLLTAFATHPSSATGKSLRNLIGVKIGELEASLKEGLGFAFWQAMSEAGASEDEDALYFGVMQQTSTTDENLVGFKIAHGKVVELHQYKTVLSISAFDTRDWDVPIGYIVYDAMSPEDEPSGADSFTEVTATWTLSQTLGPKAGANVKVISGEEKPLQWTSVVDLKQRYSQLFKSAKADFSDFGQAVAMLENAANYKPAALADHFPKQGPKELRDTFVQLVTAAVKHDTSAAGVVVGPNLTRDVFGRIAAAALKPEFRPIIVSAVQPRVVQSGASARSVPSDNYSIVCEYSPEPKTPKRARFTFNRGDSENVWILSSFEDPAVIPGTGGE